MPPYSASLSKTPHQPQALTQGHAFLRSGLYILADQWQLASSSALHGPRIYVIFWPEDTTWSSHASSATKNNRVAFMRHLTKLTDQLLIFVSPERADGGVNTSPFIECLFDVWTRFPIVPAIPRATITSGRAPPRITFVTERNREQYAPHFTGSIQAFMQRTRKPTGGRLGAINIEAVSFNTFIAEGLRQIPLSHLRAGEWLIEVTCLIPIQIAVAREDRFIPLNIRKTCFSKWHQPRALAV